MKVEKRVLAIALALLLTFTVTVSVYAYGGLAVCLRLATLNTATASIGSPFLENGTYNVFAEVDDPIAEAGAFGSNWVFAGVIDYGPVSESGTANAYVGGHFIFTGEYKEVHRSHTN